METQRGDTCPVIDRAEMEEPPDVEMMSWNDLVEYILALRLSRGECRRLLLLFCIAFDDGLNDIAN